jgi:hypothetical protein
MNRRSGSFILALLYTYVTAEEVETIAKYLPLIDKSEFEARFVPEKMQEVYPRPMRAMDYEGEYFDLLMRLQDFYNKVAASMTAVLINIG